MKNKTQRISGIDITLTRGRRYRASRPMAERGRKLYPITISDITNGTFNPPTAIAPLSMTYDEANDFLSEFNNGGATSFAGRIW